MNNFLDKDTKLAITKFGGSGVAPLISYSSQT
ncbi:hypothetical protein AI2618V1_3083 [Serratia marcescens]|nr:hypothetical protein SK68_03634 [Serratia marcescens]CAE7139856.1 hypothetical protein AI2702V1_5122 [Klebsiella pneumoniae]KMJ09421.1 hypothetical protein SN03_03506 [Serratia marcescens]WOL90843.1 hypothetical protein PPEDELGO_00044 [Serratia marcescens]WOL90958.1 hypothetical protein CBNHEBFE_00044 [Serratia marcescens]